MEQGISLFELNSIVKNLIKSSLNETFWVKAEITQIKENISGHCYIELVDKDAKSDKILAQSKATIWATTYRIIKPYFKTTTGRELCAGLKILACVKVEFHEVYGLNLNIVDIDPGYTIGDLALKRIEVIKKLQDEGVFNMNKELDFPLVPQRIAIISSETAAGYNDFVTHINENPYRYAFKLSLFQAAMQGEKAEDSIISALDAINSHVDLFDAVVIIRGGGSQTDLSCFDSYWLASNVAQFPLPIITGIGHEQDDSVTDMVSNSRVKTPTAAAELIISTVNDFELQIIEMQNQLVECCLNIISENQTILDKTYTVFPIIIKDILYKEKTLIEKKTTEIDKAIDILFQHENNVLQTLKNKTQLALSKYVIFQYNTLIQQKKEISSLVKSKIELHKLRLQSFSTINDHLNPENILKRGFSITMYNKKPLVSKDTVKAGDEIETILYKGKVSSTVK